MKKHSKAFWGIFMLLALNLPPALSQRAIDFMEVEGNSEKLYLRLISESDAISAGNGVVKIQLPGGVTGAADLVATSDPDASEVRIQTPYGTRAWREEKFPGKCWGESYWDRGEALTISSDHGLAICGSSQSYGAGSEDFLLLKIDQEDELQWGKVYGQNSYEGGYSIVQTNTGGFFLTGYAKSISDDSYYAYYYNLNSSGNIIGEGSFGTSSGDEFAFDGIQCSDNNFLFIGKSGGISLPNNDNIYVQKINSSNGNNMWSYELITPLKDRGWAIVESSSNIFAATGYTSISLLNYDITFFTLDSDGTIMNTFYIGGSGNEYGYDIINTSDGNFLIGGYTNSNGAGGFDYYLHKLDINGNMLWTTTIGGSQNDQLYAVCEANDGGILAVGSTESYGSGMEDGWLVKVDSQGNPEWSWVFGGSDEDIAYDVIQKDNGCIYVCGRTISYGSGYHDAFLIKFTQDGSTCLGNSIPVESDEMNSGLPTAKNTRIDPANLGYTHEHLNTRDAEMKWVSFETKSIFTTNPLKGETLISPTETIICN